MSEIPKMFNSPIHSDERIPYSNWNKALPFKTTNFRKTNFPQFDAQFGGSVPLHARVSPYTPTMGTAGVERRKHQQSPPESSRSHPVQRLHMAGAYSFIIRL